MLKRFIKDGSGYILFGNLAAAGFGFVGFLFITRFLDKQEFGLWMLFLSFQLFGEMFRHGLTQSAIVQYVSRYIDKKQEIIGSGWIVSILTNIFITSIAAIFYFLFQNKIHENSLHWFFIYYPAFIWLATPYSLSVWISHAEQRFKRMAFYIILIPGMVLIGNIVGYFMQLDLMYVLGMHLVIRFLASLVATLLNDSHVLYFKYATKNMIRKIFKYGTYSLGSSIGSHLNQASSTFLIGMFIGTIPVAIWSVSIKLNQVVDNPVRSVVMALFPKITQMHKENKFNSINNLLYKTIALFFFVTIPATLFVYFGADLILLILADGKYPEAKVILQTLTIFMLFIPIDKMMGVTINAINKPQFNTIKIAITTTFSIIVTAATLYLFRDLIWVAYTSVATIMLGTLVGALFLKKEIGFHIHGVLTNGLASIWNVAKKHNFNPIKIAKA